jgi:hypothetical protein
MPIVMTQGRLTLKNCMNAGAVRKSILVLALGVSCALPAASQTTNSTTTGTTGSATDSTTVHRDRDDRFDWGWLGLLGLAGLAGLRRKPDEHGVHRTSTTAAR